MRSYVIAVPAAVWVLLVALLVVSAASSLLMVARGGWTGRHVTARLGWSGLLTVAVTLVIALAFLRLR